MLCFRRDVFHGTSSHPRRNRSSCPCCRGFLPGPASAGPPWPADRPVARVLIESSLPHLDRPFDYSVPAELDETAQPGVRVKVKFSGQELSGYILERVEESDAGHALVPLHKVVSPVAVLTPELGGTRRPSRRPVRGHVSDVLRVAIPPRVAKVEKELAAEDVVPPCGAVSHSGCGGTRRSGRHSRMGGLPERCRLPSAPKRGRVAPCGPERAAGLRPGRLAPAHRRGRGGRPASGRGAVVVVPDYRDLDRVEAALADVLPPETSPGSPPTTARRPGTAATFGSSPAPPALPWAPARQPMRPSTTWASWCAGTTATTSTSSSAPRTPTPGRSSSSGRSRKVPPACWRGTPAARNSSGWWTPAGPGPSRPTARWSAGPFPGSSTRRTALNRNATPWPGSPGCPALPGARPRKDWSAARSWCRWPAPATRRRWSATPAGNPPAARLQRTFGRGRRQSAVPQCRWCSARRRPGAAATAAARGCAAPPRASCGPRRNWAVPSPASLSSPRPGTTSRPPSPDTKALVVATVGAEPVAAGGYAAALLLDGDSLLRRENLRAGEDAVRRWFNAAALVSPAARAACCHHRR